MQPIPAQHISELVQHFAALPPEKRQKAMEMARFLSGQSDGMGHPERHVRQFNTDLLKEMQAAERQLERPKPRTTSEPVTWAKTGRLIGTLAKPASVFLVVAGGGYVAVSFIAGAAVAIETWAIANPGTIVGVLCAAVAVVVFAYMPSPFKSRGDETKTVEEFEQETFYQKTSYKKTTQ